MLLIILLRGYYSTSFVSLLMMNTSAKIFSHAFIQSDLLKSLEISQTTNLQESAAQFQPKVNLFESLFSFSHRLVTRLLVK